MPEFDEALVKRLAKALRDQEEEALKSISPTAVNARVRGCVQAVLTTLSQDYLIIPRNSGEERDAAKDLELVEKAGHGLCMYWIKRCLEAEAKRHGV
jgi:hypothetical protein